MKIPDNRPSILTHITREEGEVVRVTRELILPGPFTIAVGGRVIGVTKSYSLECPVWEKPKADG